MNGVSLPAISKARYEELLEAFKRPTDVFYLEAVKEGSETHLELLTALFVKKYKLTMLLGSEISLLGLSAKQRKYIALDWKTTISIWRSKHRARCA